MMQLLGREYQGQPASSEAKEKAWNRLFLPEPSEGTNPADTMISNFQPPDPWKHNILLFSAIWLMELCYWQLWETNTVVITAYLNAYERSGLLFFLFIFKKNNLFPETKILGGLLWKALLEAPHKTCLGKPLFLSLYKITQNLQESHSQNMASIMRHHNMVY